MVLGISIIICFTAAADWGVIAFFLFTQHILKLVFICCTERISRLRAARESTPITPQMELPWKPIKLFQIGPLQRLNGAWHSESGIFSFRRFKFSLNTAKLRMVILVFERHVWIRQSWSCELGALPVEFHFWVVGMVHIHVTFRYLVELQFLDFVYE
jgi:hypothetical protein